jgi:uncharacterized lipoprotein YmbA
VRTLPKAACVVAAAALLGACSFLRAKPDPSRYYVLTQLPADPGAVAASKGPAVGIGPVVLPRYLARPEVVLRVAPNEIRPSEYDLWASSLQSQVERTLAANVATLLASDRVVIYPWYRGVALDFVVRVDVVRFEPDEDGVHLIARWVIVDGRGTMVRSGETDLHEPMASRNAAAAAAAMSRALGGLSREVADAINAVHG